MVGWKRGSLLGISRMSQSLRVCWNRYIPASCSRPDWYDRSRTTSTAFLALFPACLMAGEFYHILAEKVNNVLTKSRSTLYLTLLVSGQSYLDGATLSRNLLGGIPTMRENVSVKCWCELKPSCSAMSEIVCLDSSRISLARCIRHSI